ncbi:domain found in Dishevelled, Egl-10, and Pleckstrin [Ostertagia ostertagi]
MVSAPVPQYMKGSLNRRHVQQQYIVASSLTRKASSKELITSSIVERTNFLMDFIGECRQSQRSVAPLMYSKGEFAFQNKSRVAQLVSRLENASSKKPPLAVPEVVDGPDEPKKLKRKYAKHLTSTKILHSIFGRDSEKKKSDPTLSDGGVVALTGGAVREPVVLRNRQNGGSLGSRSENAKSTHIEPSRIRSLIKKRRSEGCIAVTADEAPKNQRSKTGKQSDGFSSRMESPRCGSALVDISRRELDLKEGEDIVLRPLEPRLEDRPTPSLVIEKKSSPDLSAPTATFLEECQYPLRRRPYNTIGGGPLMKCERRMLHSRPLSRTMTAVENRILPPLYENGSTSEDQQQKRPKKRYMGSHTTSSFQGKNVAAPDATPRRHLIGFLHRTSHLSLTRHRGRRFEDSTIGSESDARMFSDDDDRGSTTTDITSVSRQHENMYRKQRRRRQYRRPSRASSFSSITESSMSLDVDTVILNMDTVNFLGISIVGQSSARGDNGIYVANIMKGGAVALDGRISAGDMILQVNDISFDNFTNDQAVDVLRDAVARKGPIKLTVAKCFDSGPKSCFTIPRNHRDEPVRPIDTQAWIQHTNAMRGMPSILEGSEGAPTPIPGDWPHGRPPSSSTVTSTGSNGQNTVVTGQHVRLDIHTDKKKVVEVMAMPNSGLDIKNRTWLKIPIPMSFLGKDLLDWLLAHVDGLLERKDARKYAAELLKRKLIAHVVNKITFTEQCYYVLGEECADFARYRAHPEDLVAHQHAAAQQRMQWTTTGPGGAKAPASMVSGYASMPVSPFPHFTVAGGAAAHRASGPDVRSQASGGSGEGSGSGSDHKRHRNVVIPAAPSTSAIPPRLDELPSDLAASRQSFRMAMNHPYEFFVDNL